MNLESPPGSTWHWPTSRRWGQIELFLLTAACYSIGSRLAILLIQQSQLQSVFFIPAGVTVAFLLRLPRRFWWVVLVAAGVSEAVMDLAAGYSLVATAGYVAGNVIEPLLGAAIVTRFCGPVDLARVRHVGWFLLGAVFIAPAVGAAIGSTPSHLVGESEFTSQFWQWWLGDSLGVLLVGSGILVWGSSRDRRSLASPAGLATLAGTAGLTIAILNNAELPLMFLVFIGIAVAGSVFGVRAVVTTALLIALLIAVYIAFIDSEVVTGVTPEVGLIIVKLRLLVFTAAGMIIAAEAFERGLAARAASQAEARATVAEERHRLEHEIALRLQEAYAPEAPVAPEGVSLAARYAAGNEAMVVGGDWYDVFELPDGRIGFTVGDVIGHGLEATVDMGRLKTASAALAPHSIGPSDLLRKLDQYAQGRNSVQFATVACAILDTSTGGLRYAMAGHPPFLVVHPGGGVEWLRDGLSPPLHGVAGSDRSEASITLSEGDLVIAYTDGLVERRGEEITVGLRRLETHTREMSLLSTDDISDGLLAALGVDSRRSDDVVILVLRYEGHGR